MEQKSKIFQVLLQDRKTRTFLASDDHWTGNPKHARNFHDGASAVAHVLNHSLGNAQLVMQSGRSGDPSLTVPVSWSSDKQNA